MVVARGRYRKGIAGREQNMQERVTLLFHRFKADLDKMCMVNALNLKEEDLEFIKKLNEISNNLEASIWELEDFGKEAEKKVEKEAGAEKAPEPKGKEEEKKVYKAGKEDKEEKKEGDNKKEKKEPKAKGNSAEEAA